MKFLEPILICTIIYYDWIKKKLVIDWKFEIFFIKTKDNSHTKILIKCLYNCIVKYILNEHFSFFRLFIKTNCAIFWHNRKIIFTILCIKLSDFPSLVLKKWYFEKKDFQVLKLTKMWSWINKKMKCITFPAYGEPHSFI